MHRPHEPTLCVWELAPVWHKRERWSASRRLVVRHLWKIWRNFYAYCSYTYQIALSTAMWSASCPPSSVPKVGGISNESFVMKAPESVF